MQNLGKFKYPDCGTGKTWTMEKGCQTTTNIVECNAPTATSINVSILDSTNSKRKTECIKNDNNILSGSESLPVKNCPSPGIPNTEAGSTNLPFSACNVNLICANNDKSLVTYKKHISGNEFSCINIDPKINIQVGEKTKISCPTGYNFNPSKRCI